MSNENLKPIIHEIQYGTIKVNLNKLMEKADISTYKLNNATNIRFQTIQTLKENNATRIDFNVLAKVCYTRLFDINDILEDVRSKSNK